MLSALVARQVADAVNSHARAEEKQISRSLALPVVDDEMSAPVVHPGTRSESSFAVAASVTITCQAMPPRDRSASASSA